MASSAPSSPTDTPSIVGGIALFEASKGAVVFLAGFGVLSLLHKDVQAIAAELLTHFHLNPAKHYPGIFLDAAEKLTDARLWTLAALAAAYGTVRFIEAYGLWRERRWAEWLAAGSGGLYIPFEIKEMTRGFAWLSVAELVINVAIVGVMVDALRHQRAAGP
ncbi:DUF2127 domain-containing protein [Methylolobus aquaticus]